MSKARLRPAFVAMVLTFAIASVGASMAFPAYAAPNRGDFKQSSEGFRLASDCKFYGKEFAKAEAEADKRSGTKEAKKYADAADTLWDTGVDLGCSWAK